MLKAEEFLAMVSAAVLCAALGPFAAQERESVYTLPKGTKPVTVTLAMDQTELPEGARPGVGVDIVGEISDPIKTGIGLLNVRLLAIDSQIMGVKQPLMVTVQLTAVQREILEVMQKHGTKLVIRLHGKEKPKEKPKR